MLFGRIGLLITLVCAMPVIVVPTRTIIMCEVLGPILIASKSDVDQSSIVDPYNSSPILMRTISDGDIISQILHPKTSPTLRVRSTSEPGHLMRSLGNYPAEQFLIELESEDSDATFAGVSLIRFRIYVTSHYCLYFNCIRD